MELQQQDIITGVYKHYKGNYCDEYISQVNTKGEDSLLAYDEWKNLAVKLKIAVFV